MGINHYSEFGPAHDNAVYLNLFLNYIAHGPKPPEQEPVRSGARVFETPEEITRERAICESMREEPYSLSSSREKVIALKKIAKNASRFVRTINKKGLYLHRLSHPIGIPDILAQFMRGYVNPDFLIFYFWIIF